jgi:hypothetical protein
LSSAILYAAIIAIWAGVLIPRWLKRDSSSGSSGAAAWSDVSGVAGESADGPAALGDDAADAPRRRGNRRDARREERSMDGGKEGEALDDLGHRQALSARRRLLGLLVVLAAGAGALAGTRMAAWWVVLPPTVMLLGYLPLLRAASKVDTERRELAARDQASQRADYSRARDVGEPVAHVTPVRLAVPAEVVDAMAEDEIYDQYTDAKLRAVGD